MEVLNKNTEVQKKDDLSVDGVRTEMEWYENGKEKSVTTYKGDVKHGEYKEWYEDGQLRVKTTYNEGNLDGLYERWYPDGKREL